jgi:cytochrome oxidase assembly protein ShyY1
VVWFLAVIDLTAGAYLLVYAQRRERRDKPGVLAVGVTLVVCAALLGGLGTWQALQEPAEPVAPGAPDLPARTI